MKKNEDFCGCKTVYTAQGLKGDKGDPGALPVAYEYYNEEAIDYTWTAANGVVTNMTHVMSGTSGNFSVHLDLRNRYRDQSSGTIKLFVGGVEVVTWGPNQQGLLGGANDFIQITDSFTWSGPIANGAVVEVKTISTTPDKIATFNFSFLILER